jgi:hypothetical protein
MQRQMHGLSNTVLAAAACSLLAACSPRFDWREVRSPEGFAVMLPGRPQTVEREIVLEAARIPMSMTSTGIGATIFAVGVARLPPVSTSDPEARQRTLTHFREALVSNSGRSCAGRPPKLPAAAGRSEAIEATGRLADGRNSRLAARFFIVDDRLFQVVALGAEGEIPPDALDTFFTSFRLIR